MKRHKGYHILCISPLDSSDSILTILCLECRNHWSQIITEFPTKICCVNCRDNELKDPAQWAWEKAVTNPPVQACFTSLTTHEPHEWWGAETDMEVRHCPGVEKKRTTPYILIAPCPDITNKTVHEAHSWEALNKIWWCKGMEKKPQNKYFLYKWTCSQCGIERRFWYEAPFNSDPSIPRQLYCAGCESNTSQHLELTVEF